MRLLLLPCLFEVDSKKAAPTRAAFRVMIEPIDLHVRVVWPAAAFWRYPSNVLGRILDVTRFAMHTVLRVDLQTRIATILFTDDFVNTCRAITLLWRIIQGQVVLDRHAGILERQVYRLVFFMVGKAESDAIKA